MNKVRSITKFIVFFAVTAVLFAPAPSLGEENSKPRRIQSALGFYPLGVGEECVIALTIPEGSKPIRIFFTNASGETLLPDPIIVNGTKTQRTSKKELLIFITPKIIVENTGDGLVLTDPEGNQYNLTGTNDKSEFTAIAEWSSSPPGRGVKKASGSITVIIRDESGRTTAVSRPGAVFAHFQFAATPYGKRD